MKAKSISQVLPEERLAEDIYAGDTLIIKKGTKMTPRLINRLKKRGIKELKVIEPNTSTAANENQPNTMGITATQPLETNRGQYSEEELGKHFFHILEKIGYEYRYGKLLNRKETVLFLKQLFINIHKNYGITDTLSALYKWDSYAYIHSFDVFVLGSLMAEKLTVTDLETCAAGFLFHDIGKIETPREILHKQAKLTGAEFKQIQKHTTDGERLLQSLGYEQLGAFARSHHERLDGSGYPDGLSGGQLPLELRILSIVDVFSALTLKRAYKEEVPAYEAIKILLKDQKQFDWHILYHFIDALMIYPYDATVLLSNNEQAKISSVSKYYPTVPQVRLLKGGGDFSLPTNFSLTVQKILAFQPKSDEQLFREFLDNLSSGDQNEVKALYQTLSDGLHYHHIFEKILFPAVAKLNQMAAIDELSSVAYHKSTQIVTELLIQIEQETERYTTCRSSALILYPAKETAYLYARLLSGFLRLEAVQAKLVTESAANLNQYFFSDKQPADHILLLNFPNDDPDSFMNQYPRLALSSFNEYNTQVLQELFQKNKRVFIDIIATDSVIQV
ncbi:HD-GYP domain-containing protein [Sediminibacillus sp. JSM 1682029]|uniref:HD-GYP domain-containing protein n=1 Tax=Sediminibacillus sp. JSM 1682029 TaxID=3229857 RepID=UPI003524F032